MRRFVRTVSIGALITGAVLAGAAPAYPIRIPECPQGSVCTGPQPEYRPTVTEARSGTTARGDGGVIDVGDRFADRTGWMLPPARSFTGLPTRPDDRFR